jgi:hypothetical protein
MKPEAINNSSQVNRRLWRRDSKRLCRPGGHISFAQVQSHAHEAVNSRKGRKIIARGERSEPPVEDAMSGSPEGATEFFFHPFRALSRLPPTPGEQSEPGAIVLPPLRGAS